MVRPSRKPTERQSVGAILNSRPAPVRRVVLTTLALVAASSTMTGAIAFDAARISREPGSQALIGRASMASEAGRPPFVLDGSAAEGGRAESDSYVETLLQILRQDEAGAHSH
jgi:hypothetical protein